MCPYDTAEALLAEDDIETVVLALIAPHLAEGKPESHNIKVPDKEAREKYMSALADDDVPVLPY